MARFKMQERDLDLVLLEELHSDTGFAPWLAEAVGLPGFDFCEARHSVSARAGAEWGETDVLAFFAKSGERVAVLVEDKIDAHFTNRQAERYHDRAREIVQAGEADRYVTLLVAPANYLAGVPTDDPWHHRLAIETIADWFGRRHDAHARWRAAILTECLARIRPTPAPNREDVDRFGRELAAYLKRHHHPTLSHVPGRDPTGPTIHFPGWTVERLLWWKVGKDRMSLQLSGSSAARASQVALPEGVFRESHAKYADLYIPVPAIDFSVPVEHRRDTVEAAMAAAYRLITLLRELDIRETAV